MIERDMSNDYIKAINTQGQKTIKEVSTSVSAGTNSLEIFKDLKLKQLKNAFNVEIEEGKKNVNKIAEEKMREVVNAGNNEVGVIVDLGSDLNNEIKRVASEQKNILENTGAMKLNLISRLGQDTIEAITKEGNKQFNRVATKGEEEYQRIIATGIDGKVSKSDIINDLNTGGADKVLSAEMGKKLDSDKVSRTDNTLMISRGNFNGRETNLDSLTQSGVWKVYGMENALAPDYPSVYGWGFFKVERSEDSIVQTYIDNTDKNTIYTRSSYDIGMNWRKWKKNNTARDVGAFVANTGELHNTDLNNIIYSGGYKPGTSIANMPNAGTYGTLLVTRSGYGDTLMQMYSDYDTSRTFIRTASDITTSGTGNWRGWKEIFTTGNCPIQKSDNGYTKLPNGLVMQWGRSYLDNPRDWKNNVFPIAFPNKLFTVTCTPICPTVHAQSPVVQVRYDSNNTSFLWHIPNATSAWSVYWIAIGY